MNKLYNIQNTNICNDIFHISFFKALLINEGETTRGETTHGAKRPGFKYIGKCLSGEILLTRECSIVTICEDTDSK